MVGQETGFQAGQQSGASLPGQAARARARSGTLRTASLVAWLIGAATLAVTAVLTARALSVGVAQLRADLASPVTTLGIVAGLLALVVGALYCLAGFLLARARRGGAVLALALACAWILFNGLALNIRSLPGALANIALIVLTARAWPDTAPPA